MVENYNGVVNCFGDENEDYDLKVFIENDCLFVPIVLNYQGELRVFLKKYTREEVKEILKWAGSDYGEE